MVVAVYRRREPEKTVTYQVVRDTLPAFLELADSRGNGLPKYVRNAFKAYLDCGILKRGFARVRCPDCGYDAVVAFS